MGFALKVRSMTCEPVYSKRRQRKVKLAPECEVMFVRHLLVRR
jgi:hypothetical protein